LNKFSDLDEVVDKAKSFMHIEWEWKKSYYYDNKKIDTINLPRYINRYKKATEKLIYNWVNPVQVVADVYRETNQSEYLYEKNLLESWMNTNEWIYTPIIMEHKPNPIIQEIVDSI
jgi:hypothetical protein